MNILLTNDDGIYADGIRILANILIENGHKVTITAPDRERSAAGHSITINEPLRAKKIGLDEAPNSNCIKISGTPADCVKLGLEKFVDKKPDLIISGINNGANLGYDVLYSGTVSAAIEAWMLGYTALAVSLAVREEKNFKTGAFYINNLLKKNENILLNEEKMLLNINIPDIVEDKIKGVEITKLGTGQYEDHFEKRVDPMGNDYYWMAGKNKDIYIEGTDVRAVADKKISITPLSLNLTDFTQKRKLNKFLNK